MASEKPEQMTSLKCHQRSPEPFLLGWGHVLFDNLEHVTGLLPAALGTNHKASWCGPCKSEMPDFNEIYLEQGDEIQFLMINLTDGYQETLEQAKAFVEESGYSFPVYFDVKSDAAYTYGVTSIPTTYFIDASGAPVAYGRGAMSAETLLQGIDMITE